MLDDGLPRRRLRGPLPGAEREDRAPRGRLQGDWTSEGQVLRRPWAGLRSRGARCGSGGPQVVQRLCPATGLSVASSSWEAEKAVLAAVAAVIARAVRPGQDGAGAQGLLGSF